MRLNKIKLFILTALILTIISLYPSTILAQTVAVTGTITDTQTTPYSNGLLTVTLVNSTGQLATFGGNPSFQKSYAIYLDANGAFTISLPPNSTASPSIQPAGTQWNFSYQSQGGYGAANINVTITGAGSISGTLSNLARITWPYGNIPPPGAAGQGIVFVSSTTLGWGLTGGGSAFPLTVSGTVNSGGIPCFTSTTVEASSILLGAGVIPKGGGAGACIGASSITDNATKVITTEPLVSTQSVQAVGAAAQAMNLYVSGGCDGISACTGFFWGLQAPASMAASLQYTPANTDGTGGQGMATDGSQHFKWLTYSSGISNFNQAAQSQVVVSATEYYITRSDLDMPAAYTQAIAAGTTMKWRVSLTKTAAGTGTFQVLLKKGTNGSTADTSIVTQTIGTQTAAADNMEMDVQLTWTSATAAYWTIVPHQSAASGTGFGLVYPAAAAQFSGTISAQTTTTVSDKYGLSLIFTTGTPTFVVNEVQAQAFGVI